MRSLPLVLLTALTLTGWAQTGSAKPKSAKTTTTTAQEVQALKDALAAQQRQMQQQSQQMNELKAQLQQLLEVNQQAASAAQSSQSRVQEAQSGAAQAQQTAAEAQKTAEQASANAVEAKAAAALVDTRASEADKRLSALQDVFGRFRFSGDVRIRFENYNQDTVPDRNRARVRVRFGLDGKLNEDFIGAFAIATGSQGDPTTTNETLTNYFDRKTIALDRGFITYNPVAHNWLSLTGGKFLYSWQRTSQTFDPDLNPEGFNEKFSFNFGGPMKNVTAQGIELLYNEANGKPGIPSQDSYALGGQVSARFEFGPWTATPSILSLKWNRPDSILSASAFATAATTTGYLPSGATKPITGIPIGGEGQGCAKGLNFPAFPPCAFGSNGMTNSTFVDSKGVLHFTSGFNYIDFILNNQFKTGAPRLPVNLMLEFIDNPDAAAHPLDTKGKAITNLGSQNKEYGFDLSVGQTKNKNDLQFGYAWYREEQDAVIASFVESDQRAPTNILQNKFYALWKLRANTTASFTWWRGRALNTNLENNVALFNNYNGSVPTIKTAGQQEPYLNRLQFDLIYAF